jgi:hypothetical protein
MRNLLDSDEGARLGVIVKLPAGQAVAMRFQGLEAIVFDVREV